MIGTPLQGVSAKSAQLNSDYSGDVVWINSLFLCRALVKI